MHLKELVLLHSTCFVLITMGFQCPPGGYNNIQRQFGPGCIYRCHCVDDVQCDNDTGECPVGCAKGWMGPGCQYGDIAYQKTTWQVSNRFSYTGPEKAVDGNTSSCSETNQMGEQWLTVDLNAVYRITGLVIHSGEPDAQKAFEVRVGNVSSNSSADFPSICFKHSINENISEVTHVLCTSELVGKHLMIWWPELQTTMKLCDVRVYGGRSVTYRRFAKQSSLAADGEASRAVDGGTSTRYGDNTCTHTEYERSAWWRVDLVQVYNILRIQIFNREDCCAERLSGFSVSFATNITFSLVFNYPEETPMVITEVTTFSKDLAQLVEIRLKDKTQYLTLCEVFVFGDCQDNVCGWTCDTYCYCEGPIDKQNKIYASCPGGCKTGWWGYSCNNTCHTNCKDNSCSQSDGHCFECFLGKWGHLCENDCTNCQNETGCGNSDGICTVGCLTGWWGYPCNNACDTNCKDNTCSQSDGHCFECFLGKWGHFCENDCRNCLTGTGCGNSNGICTVGCLTGLYGVNCNKYCGHCAGDGSCNRSTGACSQGCQPGCQEENCTIACTQGWYGLNCSNICGQCAKISCGHINGTCPFGCSEGYNGTTCFERLEDKTISTESSSTLPIGVPVGGALGAASLSIIIILSVILWRRRKRAPETSQIERTYDQIDTTRVIPDISSEYAKIDELGLSTVTPKESTYYDTLSEENLIPKCEFRNIYQNYVSLDDKTGELKLLSVFKNIGDPGLTKTKVTRSRRTDDYIKKSNKTYLFEATRKKESTILSDFPTTSEAFWRIALERKVHLIIIVGENCIQFKPKVQVEIGLIQIECVDIAIERDHLLCSLNVTGIEKEAKVRNVQVVLSSEERSFCVSTDINKTVAVLRKRLHLRKGIEVFNTLINSTPDAKDAECFIASLLVIDFMERSGNIDIIGIIQAMRKEKNDVIDTFDRFKFCHDVVFKWIVDEENE